MSALPEKARVVIIGGGVIGCSVAYHLTKLGWKDVVLLERKQLTSGTTWHAAGLIAQLRATANMTKLAKYSQELYGNARRRNRRGDRVQTRRLDHGGPDRRAARRNLPPSGHGAGLWCRGRRNFTERVLERIRTSTSRGQRGGLPAAGRSRRSCQHRAGFGQRRPSTRRLVKEQGQSYRHHQRRALVTGVNWEP